MKKLNLLALPLALSLMQYSARSEAIAGVVGCALTGYGVIASPSCGQIATSAFVIFMGVGGVAAVSEEGGLVNSGEWGGSANPDSGIDVKFWGVVIFKANAPTLELDREKFKSAARTNLTPTEYQQFLSAWPIVESSYDQSISDASQGTSEENIQAIFKESLEGYLTSSLSSTQRDLLSRVTVAVVKAESGK